MEENTNYENLNDNSPMTTKEWLKIILLMFIPIVDIILLFVWSFGSKKNENIRSFSRATLILLLIGILLALFIGNLMWF